MALAAAERAKRSREKKKLEWENNIPTLTLEEGKKVKPTIRPIKIPCSSCEELVQTSPRYLKGRESYTCLTCLNLSRGEDVKKKIGKTLSSKPQREKKAKPPKTPIPREQTIEKIKESNKKTWSEKKKKEHSKLMVSHWKNAEYREKQRRMREEEAYKKAVSERSKKMWRNEDYHAKMSLIAKERWEDEEYREKNEPSKT